MNIAVIGSGMIGSTTARLFVAAGHEVTLANRRGPDSLRALVSELGPRASAASLEDAVRGAELVLLAIPFRAIGELPAEPFRGKIVVDANNYYPGRDGEIPELLSGQTTSSEQVAGRLTGARVVKAFNTMYYATLAGRGDTTLPVEQRLALFLAGDDLDAKAHVGSLIEELGFAAIDTGSLSEGGRRQQPGSRIYNTEMTGAQARATLEG